ncbi:ATP-binding protein [Vibrio sp.]|uniref:PAS domain-containing sensor histidine kinase n=2 Tax=unclassified Vibrio TaxID=2614977 RepID=UPI003D12F0F8
MHYKDIPQNPWLSRIGKKIILTMVLVSSLFTLVATSIQLFNYYRIEMNEVKDRHQEIETLHIELIASALWAYDLPLVQQHMNLLVQLPKIDYLEIQSNGTQISSGTPPPTYAIEHVYPINHIDQNEQYSQKIGILTVLSNTEGIYNNLVNQFISILIINTIKTLFVCICLLFVFHMSINRRIFNIVDYLHHYDLNKKNQPLQLHSSFFIDNFEDEIDILARETNRLTAHISHLYKGLQLEKERLNDFTKASSDWLWETNADGYIIYCSENMATVLSIPAQEHKRFRELPYGYKFNQLQKMIDNECDFSHCEVNIDIGGESEFFIFQALVKKEHGKFSGFRGTALNITRLKQVQLELSQLNNHLEQQVDLRTQELTTSLEQLQQTQQQLIESEKLSALGGLVSGVAHEVNTPLGIAVTSASIIQESAQQLHHAFSNSSLTSQNFTETMSNILDSSDILQSNLNRAAKLIRDFKQTAVDQVSEARSEFDLQQVLMALLASLHSQTRQVPVTPVLLFDQTIQMNSLPGAITQIFTNLILNSVNHAFHHTPQASIIIKASKADHNTVILDYSDNGAGIEPHLHQKVFEPFYTTMRGKGGSGLGLNIVFNLVKKLHGELTLDSKPNQGVHFTIKLPINYQYKIEIEEQSP